MGRLLNKKSPHPWFALALAMQAVLESGQQDAIDIATQAFNEAIDN